MPVSKKEKDRRVAAGFCEQCGIEPLDGETRKGVECKKLNKEARIRQKQVKEDAGVCTSEGCHNPPKEGCKHCQECITKLTACSSNAYHRKKPTGDCPYCLPGTPCVKGKSACQKHLDSNNKPRPGTIPYTECKALGVCYYCTGQNTPSLPGKAYCEEHRQENNRRGRVRHKKNRKVVLDHYGAKCACCGFTYEPGLQIDHINGGGTKHLKELKSNGALYRWLIKNNFPPGFQVLCILCNGMKRHMGDCPHCTWPLEAQELTWKYTRELADILARYEEKNDAA